MAELPGIQANGNDELLADEDLSQLLEDMESANNEKNSEFQELYLLTEEMYGYMTTENWVENSCAASEYYQNNNDESTNNNENTEFQEPYPLTEETFRHVTSESVVYNPCVQSEYNQNHNDASTSQEEFDEIQDVSKIIQEVYMALYGNINTEIWRDDSSAQQQCAESTNNEKNSEFQELLPLTEKTYGHVTTENRVENSCAASEYYQNNNDESTNNKENTEFQELYPLTEETYRHVTSESVVYNPCTQSEYNRNHNDASTSQEEFDETQDLSKIMQEVYMALYGNINTEIWRDDSSAQQQCAESTNNEKNSEFPELYPLTEETYGQLTTENRVENSCAVSEYNQNNNDDSTNNKENTEFQELYPLTEETYRHVISESVVYNPCTQSEYNQNHNDDFKRCKPEAESRGDFPKTYRKLKRKFLLREQHEILTDTFTAIQYPTREIIVDLSKKLQLCQQKIDDWFKNKRRRVKKEKQKTSQERERTEGVSQGYKSEAQNYK